MSLPTPQDFEKAKTTVFRYHYAIDLETGKPVKFPAHDGTFIDWEHYDRLESEKSLLEKRVRELEAEIKSRIEQHDFQLEARENMIGFKNDRIKALEAENDEINAKLQQPCDSCKTIIDSIVEDNNKFVELESDNSRLKAENERLKESYMKDGLKLIGEKKNLESRLAEAVRVLDNLVNDENTIKEAVKFLQSPTNSKALEIARDAVIESVRQFKNDGTWGRVDSLFGALEALDALTSEEGKV